MSERIFLDHASTTPMPEAVIETMTDTWRRLWANPSSLHLPGLEAARVLKRARADVARFIGAAPEEIYFTSGGTEANNWVFAGLGQPSGQRRRVIVSSVEHQSVLEPARALSRLGFEVVEAGVDGLGMIDLERFRQLLDPDTALVSVMLGNNQVGTLQPVAMLAKLCHAKGTLLHSDAVQAAGYLDIDVQTLGVDLLTLSAHKLGGPKGIGALYLRRGTALEPLLRGGHQQQGRRAGTIDPAAAAGFAAACRLVASNRGQRLEKVRTLRRLLHEQLAALPGLVVNGHPELCLPHILNFSIPGLSGQLLLAGLDQHGISVSTGSACSADQLGPSHVLLAMGLDHERAEGALRVSLGPEIDAAQIRRFVAVLSQVVADVRAMHGEVAHPPGECREGA